MHALAPPLRRTSGGDGAFALGIEIDDDAIEAKSPEKTSSYVHESSNFLENRWRLVRVPHQMVTRNPVTEDVQPRTIRL